MRNSWGFQEDGSIGQSLSDMQDDSVRLFTQTAAEHNQLIQSGVR
jgi:hypothetical protein